MMKFILPLAALMLLASPLRSDTPADETRLLRFPATNGKQVVFSYADQLYTVGVDGGLARRLTNGPGYAVFPRFSPDGGQLAFTAQYDGNTEVYLMPAEGGTPKRLTYTATVGRDDLGDRMGPNNIVMAWKNTVSRGRVPLEDALLRPVQRAALLRRSGRRPSKGAARAARRLPVVVARRLQDGLQPHLPGVPDLEGLPRRNGRRHLDLRLQDRRDREHHEQPRPGHHPDVGAEQPDLLPFRPLSEGAKRLNLYSYDLATKATAQHTHFRDFDIKFPSLGGGAHRVRGGRLHLVVRPQDGRAKRLPIEVRDDFVTSRPAIVNVAAFVANVSLSPDGKRGSSNARGNTFTVPAKDGATRNLSTKSGVHERDAVWSPDGKWIAYVSDESGENELYVRAQDGTGSPEQLTKGADTYYYNPLWSPDSKKLLWSDRLQRLRYVTVETKAVTLVDTATAFEIRQYAWSPDSEWITWSRPEDQSLTKVWLYGLKDGVKFAATDGWYEASSPSFSDDGKYLLFASGRDFKPTLSDFELEHIYKDLERVYLITLAKDTESPFKPKSDEVQIAPAAPKADDKAADAKDAKKDSAPKAVVVKVDPDGIKDRLVGLPIKAANYDTLTGVGDNVYYLRSDSDGAGDDEDGGAPDKTLLVYNLKDQKETELGAVAGYEVSHDGKKMLVAVGKDFAIIDLPTAKFEVKDKLSFGALEMNLDRHAEWAQIYDECWRQMRDFFFSPTMNGVDWPAMRAKYAALVPYAQTRYDLTYLIGELIGEIHSGHTYVGGGDRPQAPKVPLGLLGAQLSRDPQSRAYRIDKILHGENWVEAERSPLTEIGVNVSEGDYILAVDGKPVADSRTSIPR
jgi:tricorn protease